MIFFFKITAKIIQKLILNIVLGILISGHRRRVHVNGESFQSCDARSRSSITKIMPIQAFYANWEEKKKINWLYNQENVMGKKLACKIKFFKIWLYGKEWNSCTNVFLYNTIYAYVCRRKREWVCVCVYMDYKNGLICLMTPLWKLNIVQFPLATGQVML